MALQIHWQTEVHGEEVRQEMSLFGQGFTVTIIGEVIVDSTWLLPVDCRRHARVTGMEAIESGLLKQADVLNVSLLEQGTVYSRAVWNALTEISLGQVITYSELADKLNSGPRAVALACRNNPYPGIIPCHRVVSKSGIGGFMGQSEGSWVELKRQLLDYERKMA